MSDRARELVEAVSFRASGRELHEPWMELMGQLIAVLGDDLFVVSPAKDRGDVVYAVTVSHGRVGPLVVGIDPKMHVVAGDIGDLRQVGVRLTSRGWRSIVKDEETVPVPGERWPVKDPVLVLTELVLAYYKMQPK